MKKYKAINEQEWIELVDISITMEEALILEGDDKEAAAATLADIESRFQDINLSGEELDNIISIYNSYKPKLAEEDVYELISFDIAMNENVKMGSYNYKLNNQLFNVILK